MDPELRSIAAAIAAIRDDPDFPQLMRRMFPAPPAVPGADHVATEQRRIPGLAGAADVEVRICRPTDACRPVPVAVLFHGGGFTIGDLELDHPRALRLAADGVAAVNVAYRLAPEHPYPAAVEDCFAAVCWVAEHADELGIDEQRIGVSGASAGGNLAAAVALMARDRGGPRLVYQQLIYPCLDDRCTAPSASTRRDPVVDGEHLREIWDVYLGPARGDVISPYAAPARASDLSGLPATYMLTAELDPLRDEGIQYAQRLMDAGVPTELHNFAGAFHGFQGFDTAVSRYAVAEIHASLIQGISHDVRTTSTADTSTALWTGGA